MAKKSMAAKAADVAVSVAPKTTQDQAIDGVRVVDIVHEGGLSDGGAGTGGKLRVVLEGDSVAQLMLPSARKLAYIQRFDYGMANAGVASEGGTYVTDEEMATAYDEDRNVKAWRIDFIITPML